MKIVAAGDSITRGLNASVGGLECKSYAHWVADAADGEAVIHARVGATAAQVLDLFPDDLQDYDLALVFAGVNDALASKWDPAAFEASHGALLMAAGQAAPRVLTMTIPPWVGKMLVARSRVREANEIIRRSAARSGAEVVDLSAVAGAPQAWADWIHPTSLGQVAIADVIAGHLGLARPSAALPPAQLDAKFWVWYRYRHVRYWLSQCATRGARVAGLR